MPTFLRDLRYSLRTLRKMPGFTIVALLVLALGIGANTAIFSVVNSVVLRPLPYPDADRLALIWETDLKDGIKREGPSGPNFLDWKEQSQSFEEMALLEIGTGTLTGDGEPEQVTGLRVTTNFLSCSARRTVLGRGFTAAEGEGKARYPVAVLTNGFWKRRFASDPHVIGRTFYMNSEPYTVIGVLTPDFWQSLPTDLYVPWPVAQLRAKEPRGPRFRRHRPLETKRHDRAGASRVEHHRPPHRCPDAPACRLGCDRSEHETGTVRIHPPCVAVALGSSRTPSLAGLRQCSKPAACTRHGSPQGAWDSGSIGRTPRPPDRPDSQRKPAAQPDGRRARNLLRRLGCRPSERCPAQHPPPG